MQSDGGLIPTDRFIGSQAVHAVRPCRRCGQICNDHERVREGPVIGFDMGGTSTDVSRFDGDYEHMFESTTAGVAIQAPQVCSNFFSKLSLFLNFLFY